MAFLYSVENSGIGTFVRESNSLLAYPLFIFLHALGLSFIVGLNAAIDLRILGCAPRVPLAPMERLYPFMWAGFWVNAVSGLALLSAIATTMSFNPVFYIKLALMALAIVNMALIRRQVFRAPGGGAWRAPFGDKVLAITSLVLWTGAITAGRLTAYFGPGSDLH